MKFRFDEIAFNSTLKKKPVEEDKIHYIGLEHIEPGNFSITEWGSDVAPVGEKLIMKKGDILFGKRRAYQRKVAIAPFDGIFSAHGMVLRPKTDVIDADFFPLFISSDTFMETAMRISVGGLSPTINWKDLKEQEFELPSLEEQQTIAKKAWAAYRLKEAYQRLLVATDEMVKSQFIEMFGNPDTPIAKGHDLFTFASGKSMVKSELSNEYPYDCYGGNGITGKARDFLVANTTIVIGRVGEYCGCVHKTTEKSWITDNAIYVKSHSNKMLLDFAFHAFIIADFHRFATESGQPKITQEPLLSYEFPVPSIEEQEVFINIVRQADKSKFELKRAIEAIDKVIKSLING